MSGCMCIAGPCDDARVSSGWWLWSPCSVGALISVSSAAAGPPTDPWLDATRSVQGAGQCVDEGDDARGKVGQMDQQLVTTLTDLEQSRRCGWRAGNTVASFGAILAP